MVPQDLVVQVELEVYLSHNQTVSQDKIILRAAVAAVDYFTLQEQLALAVTQLEVEQVRLVASAQTAQTA
jgi:hypothetical protein